MRLLYETHSHTPLCKHAIGEPEEYAAAAERRGLAGIVFTCHSPMPDGFSSAVRMEVREFDAYVAMVERARREWAGRVDVRLGMESDFFPGMEKWLEKLHAMAPFHHVLGSVHPHLGEYRKAFFNGDWLGFQKQYFEHLAESAETGLFDTLAHPDLVKNELAEGAWDFEAVREAVGSSLDRIAKCGTAMELNTSGLNKKIPEMNPSLDMLAEMKKRGIPVSLGADAHTPLRVADRFEEALGKLKSVGYETVRIHLDRKGKDVSIDAAMASLQSTAALA